MKFQNKLSTKQVSAIWGIILSLLIIYLLKFEFEQSINFIFGITLFVLGISIITLFEESHKRYKILKAYDSEEYDGYGKEKFIADYFKRKSIKFYLHPQVKVPTKIWFFDNPFKKRILKPDFFLPQYNVFVEYWGMLDNEDYTKKKELKQKSYRENDIEFISLTLRDLGNMNNMNTLDWNFTQKLLSLIRDREGNNLKWKNK